MCSFDSKPITLMDVKNVAVWNRVPLTAGTVAVVIIFYYDN